MSVKSLKVEIALILFIKLVVIVGIKIIFFPGSPEGAPPQWAPETQSRPNFLHPYREDKP